MKAPSLPVMYAVGGLVAAAVVGWMVTKALDKITQPGAAKNAGTAAGSAVVDLGLGFVAGVNDTLGIPRTTDVINAANNQNINPLQPAGAWVGTTIFDLTHSKANGGVW